MRPVLKIPPAGLKIAAAIAIVLLLGGCAFSPHLAKKTTPALLAPRAHVETTDHIAYMGSDAKYHYFYRDLLFSPASYKIPVAELALANTFPLGKGKPRLIYSTDLMPENNR